MAKLKTKAISKNRFESFLKSNPNPKETLDIGLATQRYNVKIESDLLTAVKFLAEKHKVSVSKYIEAVLKNNSTVMRIYAVLREQE